MSTILIGIQARSTSKRLPNKAVELIGSKRMLDHIIDSAKSAARYVMKQGMRQQLQVDVAVLTPKGDPIVEAFKNKCLILQGSEEDVLSRYYEAAKATAPGFVVRITGDCPLIPDYLIAKHIKTAVASNYDYVSNVDEGIRTSIDGHDCEVMSYRLLEHLHHMAKDPYDREHVTPMARREPPSWCKSGFVINYHDQSHMKLSVDTPEDLARVRKEYAEREQKLFTAERKYGKQSVHRI